jgi:anti-sigma factor RsiW
MRIWFWNKQSSQQAGECDFIEAALTALFDGEATPDEALKARNHLITCARCAELWAGWNQTRYLFQQAPISAPPKLLLRILLACRLASAREASQATARSRVPARLSPERDAF